MKTERKSATTNREGELRLIAENLELKRENKKLRDEVRDREELLCRLDRSLSQMRRTFDLCGMTQTVERWERERECLTLIPAQYN